MRATPLYLKPQSEIIKKQKYLPHWQQGQVLQFVSWHLGDALPVSVRNQINAERKVWIHSHPQPWDTQTEREYFKLFSERLHKLLDQGLGSCLLRGQRIRQIVTDCIHYLTGKQLDLDCYVIMPNHVHILFSPLPDEDLSQIIQRLKSYTSHQINQTLSKKGTVWMADYWDRMIRSPRHYWKVRQYIENNPTKANLSDNQYSLWIRKE